MGRGIPQRLAITGEKIEWAIAGAAIVRRAHVGFRRVVAPDECQRQIAARTSTAGSPRIPKIGHRGPAAIARHRQPAAPGLFVAPGQRAGRPRPPVHGPRRTLVKLVPVGGQHEVALAARAETEGDQAHGLVRWFVGSLVRWFVGSLVRWFVGSLVRWFVGSLVRWFVGSSTSFASHASTSKDAAQARPGAGNQSTPPKGTPESRAISRLKVVRSPADSADKAECPQARASTVISATEAPKKRARRSALSSTFRRLRNFGSWVATPEGQRLV